MESKRALPSTVLGEGSTWTGGWEEEASVLELELVVDWPLWVEAELPPDVDGSWPSGGADGPGLGSGGA